MQIDFSITFQKGLIGLISSKHSSCTICHKVSEYSQNQYWAILVRCITLLKWPTVIGIHGICEWVVQNGLEVVQHRSYWSITWLGRPTDSIHASWTHSIPYGTITSLHDAMLTVRTHDLEGFCALPETYHQSKTSGSVTP